MKKLTKIIYRNARGQRCTGYAMLDTDSQYVWVFNNKNDQCGGTILRDNIIKVY